jgi:hypothetical protein
MDLQVFNPAYTSRNCYKSTGSGVNSHIHLRLAPMTQKKEEFLTELDRVATGDKVCITGDRKAEVGNRGCENMMGTNGKTGKN